MQIKYASEALGFPVWGLSPSSTPDDTGDYSVHGVEGATFPAHQGLAQCGTMCASETVVTPHASVIALPVLPQEAFTNIEALRSRFPDVYSSTAASTTRSTQ